MVRERAGTQKKKKRGQEQGQDVCQGELTGKIRQNASILSICIE